MKKILLCILMLIPGIASANDFELYAGTWTTFGMEFITIKPTGDSVEIVHPEKPDSEWVATYENPRIEDGKLKFEQKSVKRDGSPSPNSGEVSYCDLQALPNGKMRMRLAASADMSDAHDFILTNSQNKNSQNTPDSGRSFDTLGFLSFLDANHLKYEKGSSHTVSEDKKTYRYFDEQNRLVEEVYLNGNNEILSKKYDPAGHVIEELKLTQNDFLDMADLAQIYHQEKDVPLITSILQTLSDAAEKYAKEHNGAYPSRMQDLTETNPPYLTQHDCGKDVNMYRIRCDVTADGYTFIARSLWPHLESYVISTGGELKIQPPRMGK